MLRHTLYQSLNSTKINSQDHSQRVTFRLLLDFIEQIITVLVIIYSILFNSMNRSTLKVLWRILLIWSTLLAWVPLLELIESFPELISALDAAELQQWALGAQAAQQQIIGDVVTSLVASEYTIFSIIAFVLSGLAFWKASDPDQLLEDADAHKWPIGHAIAYGWNATKKWFYVWLTLLVIATLIMGLNYYLAFAFAWQGVAYIIQQIASWVIWILLGLWVLGLVITAVYNRQVPQIGDFTRYVWRFRSFLWASILYVLIWFVAIWVTAAAVFLATTYLWWTLWVVVSVISWIIGGSLTIIYFIKAHYFDIAVTKDTLWPWSALRRALKVTDGFVVTIIGFSIVAWLINFLWALLLWIGLLRTVPLTRIAKVKLYEIMESKNLRDLKEEVVIVD